MKEYTIVRKTDWEKVPVMEINERGKAFDPDIKAFAQVCYDDEALYVRLRAVEKNIRATYAAEDKNSMPCEDSCLEFFFSPDPERPTYFNIEMNPNGSMYLGFGDDGHHLVRLNPASKQYSFHPEVRRTEDGWELTYTVPYCFIRLFFPGFAPKSGDTMKGNAYKCGDLCPKEHYLSWNPVDWTIHGGAFHNPAIYGQFRFA